MTTSADVYRKYEWRPLEDAQQVAMDHLRRQFRDLAMEVFAVCPDNEAREHALHYLQTAKMYAVQSVVDGGPDQEADS